MTRMGLVGLMMLAFNYIGPFFLIVLVVPLFTVGLYQIRKHWATT